MLCRKRKQQANGQGKSFVTNIAVGADDPQEMDNRILSTLLQNPEQSFVVHGVSGMYHQLTAGYRKSAKNYVLKFMPGSVSEEGCHFNPLDTVRVGTDYEVMDAVRLATYLAEVADVPGFDRGPRGVPLSGSFWVRSSIPLIASVILHVLYALPNKTLHGVAAYLNDPTLEHWDVAFERMMQTVHDSDDQFGWLDGNNHPTQIQPFVSKTAREMLNKSENEKSGIISTANTFLDLYSDPIIAKWTEYSDFRVTDLQDADRPMTLYLVSSPGDREWIDPVLHVVLRQIVSAITDESRLEIEQGQIGYKGRHSLTFLTKEPLEPIAEMAHVGSCFKNSQYGPPQEKARLIEAAGIKAPVFSDAVLWARKDYTDILGPSAGILPVPETRPAQRDEWRYPQEEPIDESALDALTAELPRDTEALDALGSLSGALLDGFSAVAKACTGEDRYREAERDAGGVSVRELDDLLE